QGNRIGTDVTGTESLANSIGVFGEQALFNTVGQFYGFFGGTGPGAANLISGNTNAGLYLIGGSNNTVQGNLIGTDVTGTRALGNGRFNGTYGGLYLYQEHNAVIGGTAPGAGNVISGNGLDGLALGQNGITLDQFTTGTVIQGNYIGTDVTG